MSRGPNALLLLKNFFFSGINSILYSRPIPLLIKGGFFSLGILFFFSLYQFFSRVFRLVIIQGAIGYLLIEKMFSILFLMVLALLVFSSMLSSLSVLFTSREPELLIYLPIKSFDRYFYQTIKNTIISSWYVVILGYPIFVAYGAVYEQNTSYFILSLIIVSMFAFVSSNIGITITTAIVRLLPTQRIKQVFMLLGLFSVIYIITFFRMTKPERLYSSFGVHEILTMLQNARLPQNQYFLNDIASELISKYKYMDTLTVTQNLLKLSAYLALFFIVGWIVHHNFYKKSFIKFSMTQATQTKFVSRRLFIRLNTLFSIIYKDILHFTREVEQWSQIFILMSLIIIYIINLRNLPIVSDTIRDSIVLLNISFIGFIIAAVTLRFGYPLYSLEGKYRWVLIKSTVSKRDIILSKLFFSLVPSIIMSLILTFVSNVFLKIDIVLIAYLLLLNMLIAIVISFLGTSLGILLPKFDSDNPMQISMSIGGLLFMTCSMAYVFVVNYLIFRGFLSRSYRYIPDINSFLRRNGFIEMAFVQINLIILILSVSICGILYCIIIRKPLK